MAKRSAADSRVNPFGGKIPRPKGGYQGPIPKSTQYVSTDKAGPKGRSVAASEIDDQEAQAFRQVALGDEMPPSTRNRRVSEAALDPSVMSGAQRRMNGVRLAEDDDELTDTDEGDDDSERPADADGPYTQEAFDAAVMQAAAKIVADLQQTQRQQQVQIPSRIADVVKAAAPLTARAAHPSDAFQPNIGQTTEPAVARASNGIIEHRSGLRLVPVTVRDVDRLWDWIRADADNGQSFLGTLVKSSLELHKFLQQIVASEKDGIAIIRSLHGGEHHLGFAMLAPILTDERTAIMHIYLEKAYRGGLAQIVGPLVDMAEQVAPGVHLAVWSPDDTWARLHRKLLTPFGFTERVMFIR